MKKTMIRYLVSAMVILAVLPLCAGAAATAPRLLTDGDDSQFSIFYAKGGAVEFTSLSPVSGTLIAAGYDGKKLMGYEAHEVEALTEYSFFPDMTDAKTVKVFFWNRLRKMHPLAEYATYDSTGAVFVKSEAALIAAAADETCHAITVNADITLTEDIALHTNLYVRTDKTLTIGEGKTLQLYRTDSPDAANNSVYGTLANRGTLAICTVLSVAYSGLIDNDGTIVIDNNSGIYVVNDDASARHGNVNNETGIIDIRYGGANLTDYNGEPFAWFTPNPNEAVRSYFWLADVANTLYNLQNNIETGSNILPVATASDMEGYRSQYADWSQISYDFNTAESISLLLKNGIVERDSNMLHPYAPLTKLEIAHIMYRYAKRMIAFCHLTEINTGADVSFTDLDAVDIALQEEVAYLAKAGVFEPDSKFNPDSLMLNIVDARVNGEYIGFEACFKPYNKLREALEAQTAIVETNAALADVLRSGNVTNDISIRGNITLDTDITIKNRMTIEEGATVTAAAGHSITIGYNYDPYQEYVYRAGMLVVKGTLDIPADAALYNLMSIDLQEGTLNISGTYTDYNGGEVNGQPQNGRLHGYASTLLNKGTLCNHGEIILDYSTFANEGGTYENYGDLRLVGGEFKANTGTFKNAGRFMITDVYEDEPQRCDFEVVVTADFNRAEYTAVANTEQGLRTALARQQELFAQATDTENSSGLEYYDKIIIKNDMTIAEDLDVKNVTLHVERWVESDEETGWTEVIATTLKNQGNLTLENADIEVFGALLNSGTIHLGNVPVEGQDDIVGNVRVHQYGVFENGSTGSVEIHCGAFYVYDEIYEGTLQSGVAVNISHTVKHAAIVHDLSGFKQALTGYDRIELQGGAEPAEIMVDENLTVNADVYIAWGSSIYVPDGYTLQFTGDDHTIDNQGDITVVGTVLLGDGYKLYNDGTIRVMNPNTVAAQFENAGEIENRALIELGINGTLHNTGTVLNKGTIAQNGGQFTGNDAVQGA